MALRLFLTMESLPWTDPRSLPQVMERQKTTIKQDVWFRLKDETFLSWLKDETSSFFLSWLKVETFLDKWSNSSSFFSLSELTRLQLLCDLDYTITAWPDIWLDYATVNESSFVLPPWLGEVCLFSLGYVCIWTEAPFPNKVFSLTKVSVVLYSPVLTAPLTTWLYPVRKTIICYLFGLCIWSYRLDSPLCGNSSFSHRPIRALMLIL